MCFCTNQRPIKPSKAAEDWESQNDGQGTRRINQDGRQALRGSGSKMSWRKDKRRVRIKYKKQAEKQGKQRKN